MKLVNRDFFSATLLATAMLFTAGSASAFIATDVPGVTGGTANLRITNGVATLFGHLDSNFERELTESYVREKFDVDEVINLITHQ